jgi:hypothetical protein
MNISYKYFCALDNLGVKKVLAPSKYPLKLYTRKTSGFKMSGFKTSGFETSGFKTSGLQKVRFTKGQVSKRLVSKRLVFKFDILIKQKVHELPSLHTYLTSVLCPF